VGRLYFPTYQEEKRTGFPYNLSKARWPRYGTCNAIAVLGDPCICLNSPNSFPDSRCQGPGVQLIISVSGCKWDTFKYLFFSILTPFDPYVYFIFSLYHIISCVFPLPNSRPILLDSCLIMYGEISYSIWQIYLCFWTCLYVIVSFERRIRKPQSCPM